MKTWQKVSLREGRVNEKPGVARGGRGVQSEIRKAGKDQIRKSHSDSNFSVVGNIWRISSTGVILFMFLKAYFSLLGQE